MNNCKRLYDEAVALHNNSYTAKDVKIVRERLVKALESGDKFLQNIGITTTIPVTDKMDNQQLIDTTEEFLQKYERYYSFGKAKVLYTAKTEMYDIRRSLTTITVYSLSGEYVGSIDLEDTQILYKQFNILLDNIDETHRVDVANSILNLLREDVF